MSKLDSFRNKLATKIFDGFGSDAGLLLISSESGDAWGDDTSIYSPSVSKTVVPYNFFSRRTNHNPFGDLLEGEMDMVFSYDTTFDTSTIIDFNSSYYDIKDIREYPFQGGNVAYVARLTKRLDQTAPTTSTIATYWVTDTGAFMVTDTASSLVIE